MARTAEEQVAERMRDYVEFARIAKNGGLHAVADHHRGTAFGLYLALRLLREAAASRLGDKEER